MAVRCIFVGDEPLVEQCADIARQHGLDVVLIATANPIVRQYADDLGIAVVAPGGEVAGLDEHPADVLFSIANLRILPATVLDRVATAINFHDGPLPAYAGLNVTTWALLAGERRHGITWHLMTADVDDGPVVDSEVFPIADDETAFSLNARCYEAALTSFPRVASAIAAGTLTTTPQPAGERRLFRRHDRPARVLDPKAGAAESARTVRALDFGHRLRNPIGAARLVLGEETYVVDGARAIESLGSHAPGTLVGLDGDGARIATRDGDLMLTALSTPEGATVDVGTVMRRHGLAIGTTLPSPPAELVAAVAELEPELARHEVFWLDRLAAAPSDIAGPTAVSLDCPLDLPNHADDAAAVAAVGVWLSRITGASTVSFAVTDARVRLVLAQLAPLARPPFVRLEVGPDTTFASLHRAAAEELELISTRGVFLRDAIGRDPRLRGHQLPAEVLVELDGGRVRVAVPTTSDDAGAAARVADELATVLAGGLSEPTTLVSHLPVIGPAEQRLLDEINATSLEYDRRSTIDSLFRQAVARTPDAPALTAGTRTLTYRELGEAAEIVAGRLAAVGVSRGDRVGIAVPRGIEMLVAVLATLELGAAYVPLDPAYPAERLRFMVDDAGIAALVASGSTAGDLGGDGLPVLDPSDAGRSEPATASAHDATDLAYVIYTSGSTGTPKGVMLEHRNVINFFAAMDQVIDHDPPGIWLAVTSLSFDISVLELLWTVTRGFHVVLAPSRESAPTAGKFAAAPPRPVTFSLFYFAAGEDTASDGYRLLLESARFADRNGFEAVWTPERHFHPFGGAYPNPSVTGAALAAITTNVGIRAGSVVLPLHSPVRVAEEWAVVDNLSRGRVAISFAAGWQPNDFVLNPSAYATAKQDLAKWIDQVQRLWRGETLPLPGHDGAPVDVRTLPRPVQDELPVWLTSAGSPSTFERAGTLGVNVLTHLLGQSVEQLAENIARYRAAWREAGHAGDGRVTLMLHTYLDRDAATAREVAREPMKSYLGTAVGLLRDVASAFPTFAGRGKDTDDLFQSLSAEEMDQLLEVAAARYLGTSGLFGTPDDAVAIVEAVAEAGVDEVACLIDFGVSTDQVLDSLDLLLETKTEVEGRRALPPEGTSEDADDESVAALIARHGVTHLQCTPSLAAMLVADPDDQAALRHVRHVMVGGEALPTALAAELRGLLPDRFTNMYGPTETTIWSLAHELSTVPASGSIPIGRPIGNTTIFVLDVAGHPLPLGSYGELHIGGDGVARGYHNRPELTAERFVDRAGRGRVYATGDVVRIHPQGYVEFAGRADNQVKIRGHRIELGEIEAVLDRHPDVVQSIVVARDDGVDTRLVAYVVLHHGAGFAADTLRKHVAACLPDAMVPTGVVAVEAFPLTPNGKIDRKALSSRPIDSTPAAFADDVPTAPPADHHERLVAAVWADELERPVGRDDNFFDLGGHSLLAVKVFRRISAESGAAIALTDVFRFPTVRTFAAYLSTVNGAVAPDEAGSPTASAVVGADRGALRRRARSGGGPPCRRRRRDERDQRDRHRHRRHGRPVPRRARCRRALAEGSGGEDCLADLSESELLNEGVSPDSLASPDYVRRNGVLPDVEMFDPGFFGIGPRDAAIMDPQQRHFLECAWDALETAGHVPERFAGSIGVFAGCGMNTYMLNNLLTNAQLVDQVGMFLLRHTANDKDFLATTLSYRLDLRGPSVNVQTACSTSLVAVHVAVQSLLALECDLALAGGSTIEVPHRHGYVYQEGEILAPDGYCRAFDERSAGTVLTSGVGVVALRRLADAIEEGDPILAVIKGSAVNNDGARKVGYLAPSVDGHADVVKEALAVAGLSARDIQLLEAHGTGTAVGDPIEVAALTEAFRATTSDTGFCRLVSTKPNIGHLDTAAGVASLIKVVQALRHRTLPPLANHTAPEPAARARADTVRRPDGGRAVAGGSTPPGGGELPRRRWHERPRDRRRGAHRRGRAVHSRPAAAGPHALRTQPRDAGRHGGPARGLPRGHSGLRPRRRRPHLDVGPAAPHPSAGDHRRRHPVRGAPPASQGPPPRLRRDGH